MKGKRYTTEQKIRILREAGSSNKTILDIYRKRPISEQTFHRWKREMGMLEVDLAKGTRCMADQLEGSSAMSLQSASRDGTSPECPRDFCVTRFVQFCGSMALLARNVCIQLVPAHAVRAIHVCPLNITHF